MVSGRDGPRRAELVAALSLAIDLGLGQPMEHMLRSALIATRIADRMGLSADQRGVVFYANLVAWIGCHADSHELARMFGDDIAFRADTYSVDMTGLPFLRLLLGHAGRGLPQAERSLRVAVFLFTARRQMSELIRSHCGSASALSDHIGLDPRVGAMLAFTFERWDGGGLPAGVRGDAIPVEMHIVHLADVVEVHLRLGGTANAVAVAQARNGTQFCPAVVRVFDDAAAEITAGVLEQDVWSAALAQTPDGNRIVRGPELDDMLRAMTDFVDFKCPFLLGHSRQVADLAAAAGRHRGLPGADVDALYRAGLVHGLGRMGVPNQIWEKPGPLTTAEWERVRLYPYLTGRILSRVGGVESVVALAQTHRERLDGSGYPNGLRGPDLSAPARILAAAETYQRLREPRPHRPALTAGDAAARMRRDAKAGRFDTEAVEAVLAAAGHRTTRRAPWPAGLTGREVEVLRLVAFGQSNRQIAAELHITPKTARNHVEHLYTKLCVHNRTQAGLAAIELGLTR
ncbi:MAG: HD domain-containing phosphohydrolase [Rhodococcus sp. (in: high G+C Gram-positive bacteria)]|uniref:HD domain-containing phosphohydrolase n=1 Tax=Rhodococcus sp. TaxID=1831 RepID=UPI003BB70A30